MSAQGSHPVYVVYLTSRRRLPVLMTKLCYLVVGRRQARGRKSHQAAPGCL